MNQIKNRLLPDTFPNLINGLSRSVTNRTLSNPSKRLFQLLQRRRPNNNRISVLSFQRTIVLHPAIRQIRFRRAFSLRHRGPLLKRFEEARLIEALVVSVAVSAGWVEAAFAGGNIGGGFGEEAAGEGGVGVEALVGWRQYVLVSFSDFDGENLVDLRFQTSAATAAAFPPACAQWQNSHLGTLSAEDSRHAGRYHKSSAHPPRRSSTVQTA